MNFINFLSCLQSMDSCIQNRFPGTCTIIFAPSLKPLDHHSVKDSFGAVSSSSLWYGSLSIKSTDWGGKLSITCCRIHFSKFIWPFRLHLAMIVSISKTWSLRKAPCTKNPSLDPIIYKTIKYYQLKMSIKQKIKKINLHDQAMLKVQIKALYITYE